MTMRTRWFLVVALALASGCISGKSGPRGTNVGTGNDIQGPWNKGDHTGGGGGGSPASGVPR